MKELINKAVSWIKITSFKYVFEIFYLNFNNTFSDLSEIAFFQNHTRCPNSNVFLPMIINYHFNVMIHWAAPKKYINKKKKRKKKKSSSNLSISLLKRTRCGGWDFISTYLGMAKKQVKVLVLIFTSMLPLVRSADDHVQNKIFWLMHFFSKVQQIHKKLPICSYLLNKSSFFVQCK